jgi:hypothetical protein
VLYLRVFALLSTIPQYQVCIRKARVVVVSRAGLLSFRFFVAFFVSSLAVALCCCRCCCEFVQLEAVI